MSRLCEQSERDCLERETVPHTTSGITDSRIFVISILLRETDLFRTGCTQRLNVIVE
jgi:hypothetical protein